MCTIITEEEGNYIDTHKSWYGFSFKTRIKLKETCKKGETIQELVSKSRKLHEI